MRKLKYVKLFENFIFENLKLNQKYKFYHLTKNKYLESFLKNGISSPVESGETSKSQGGGLYLWSIEKAAITFSKEIGNKLSNLLLEFELNFNTDYFSIDRELMKYNPETGAREKSFNIYWNTFLESLKKFNNLNFYFTNNILDENLNIKKINIDDIGKYFVEESKKGNYNKYMFIISSEEIKPEDLEVIENDDDINEFVIKIESKNKKVGYFQLYVGGQYQYNSTYSMNSLDKFGIPKEFNKKILPHSCAFRYKGQSSFPIRYKIKKDNNWGDWIENN